MEPSVEVERDAPTIHVTLQGVLLEAYEDARSLLQLGPYQIPSAMSVHTYNTAAR